MATQSIDVKMFTKMFISGANNLEANKAWINDLNVFPVPDGDTGTNMSLTLTSAVKEVSGPKVTDMASAAKAVSFGSLRGARGNSGVITSQLLRGFCKVLQTKESVDAAAIAEASVKAVETAYKAVMKPKEGTILTVARG
ncbi:MAG: DAK2 domain-containing protein, partial [Lachnospiraceae bacterium]|nr:DAK2 domain-containing protein [Lachnospiraceae bacterium]